MSLAIIVTSPCLPFIILPASILISCFPGDRIFTEYDRAVGSGCVFHTLRKRNRLPERGAFFELNEPGAFTSLRRRRLPLAEYGRCFLGSRRMFLSKSPSTAR